ncbi:AraC family transcriptional regulator of adaptative response / DNA-3-methyladenine glycosylase II [Nocardiopsis mwathae]|uniref:DNA-3-methyladenine glycosylase II n=1 Tax=Nocardiopsis mwathae TaxID=1472723 RepID=A0A7W9YD68_9ACTN|nr:DNA-3-methyladenine glycosylase 2 family protein [Nocardiopsis mwathae]MBB6170003.1 AraC family transcriptional regulator of adaptative response / DNA-3-methyladenine glycosylase II [Nocardiopsis mwathae]
MDDDHCYLAVRSGDARFDGVVFVGVTSTGIYCRPSCPAVTPKRENTVFFPSAAAAQGGGFRACKRCRPDAVPGSPEWNVRADVVGRAMRLIADGAVDRDGVAGLSASLGYSPRQLQRLLTAELGAGPLALARAQRAQTARVLLETTRLPMADTAFAAGFASIRQFNDTVREVFDHTPSELRERSTHRVDADRGRRVGGGAGRNDGAASSGSARPVGQITLRLPYRPPCDLDQALEFLGARAVPGVEEVTPSGYRRVLRLPHGTGIAELAPAGGRDHVVCRLRLEELRDLGTAVQRCRRLLDLDSDPQAVAEVLGPDPLLAPLVAAAPGLRAPGHVDPAELAVRAIVGQQVSVAAARTVAGRLVKRFGTPLAAPDGGLTHAFPRPEALAAADPDELPLPRGRARALVALAGALVSGDIDLGPGADRDEACARLRDLPGIGPWTADYIRMRALGDPDVFLHTDLGVRQALRRLGNPHDARSAERRARSWSPWRSYASHHLWASAARAAPSAGGPHRPPRGPRPAVRTAAPTGPSPRTPAPAPAPAPCPTTEDTR